VKSATIYPCAERQAAQVPIAAVLSPDGTLNILPEVLSKAYFDLDYRAGQLVLVAGKYVGLIPINDQVVIDVRPKVQLKGLLRILNVAEEEIGSLDFFNRFYKEIEDRDDNVLSLLVRSLVRQLRQLAQEGLLKLYQRKEIISTFKPRVNFSRTFRQQWCRGVLTETSSDYFEFTKDNALNRLVKYTIWYAGKELQMIRGNRSELLEELNLFFNLLESVPLDTARSFLPRSIEMSRPHELQSIRAYYADIARSCLLIVGNRSVDIETSGQDVPLLSFVVNLEAVFENYARNIIKRHFRKAASVLMVGDGNKDARGLLFYDNKAIPVKPDVVIGKLPRVSVVADVKYKPKVADTDRYQIVSHALSYGTRKAVLILPTFEGPPGLTRVGQVYDVAGIELFEYRIRLDATLEDEESQFGKTMLELAIQ
jgi:5-methylcytosine-specific restriction enzyme subunit McrC